MLSTTHIKIPQKEVGEVNGENANVKSGGWISMS